MPEAGHTAALIVAAGQGSRAAQGSPDPKQFRALAGRSLLFHAARPFLDHPGVDSVQIVIGPGQQAAYDNALPRHPKLRAPVEGGATRQASVRNGLAALAQSQPARVLIHDGARPFPTASLIDRVTGALAAADAVIPALPVANTLKQVHGNRVTGTVPRDHLQAAETPQGFSFAAIEDAHRRAAETSIDFTDDAAVAEWAGIEVVTVAGDPGNVKVTTPADMAAAENRLRLEDAARVSDVRVGVGYDVHSLGPGDLVMLGGVAIPYNRGIVGHSDADVILHALTDAILGAIGDGDIGEHFPPSDPQWKGAASAQFLADAVRRVHERGGIVAHLDVAYVGQGPKVAPHREAMRASIARIAGIEIGRVGVKATTNEGMGFIGRGEGVAAHAVATIRLPLQF